MRYPILTVTVLAFLIVAGLPAWLGAIEGQRQSFGKEAFDVVSIKPTSPVAENRGSPAPCGGVIRMDARLFYLTAANVYRLIALAFGDVCSGMAQYNLLSGPDWIRSERFEIQAVIPDGTPSYTSFQVNTQTAPHLQVMMQSLLVDRFKLALHHESREVSIYSLVVAKQGARLQKSNEGSCVIPGNSLPAVPGSSRPCGGMMISPAKGPGLRFEMYGVTVEAFIKGLGLRSCLDRPIEDSSAISGKFDFSLEFTPDEATPCFPPTSANAGGPSVFTALQEQLGLRLERARGSVDTIVVDHIEKPALN